MLLNSLLKIFINRDNVLLENPLENSLIKYTLSEIFALINSYNLRMSPNFESQPEILIEQFNNDFMRRQFTRWNRNRPARDRFRIVPQIEQRIENRVET